MDIKEIQNSLRQEMEAVERLVTEALRSDVSLLNATNASLREHPGKMLRPLLSLLCAQACGTVREDSLRYAAAAELLHNATLLHDDVVDGASERRGRPTVASLLGCGASVLIGDYWLVKCMQTVLDASGCKERVIRVFARTLSHLAEGELLQMEKATLADTTQEDYLRIVYCKTASLFEAAAVSAALSVDAPESQVSALGDYARLLGIAFQIKDDIFDYQDSTVLGKPVGIDLQEQKITQPLLCALETATPEQAQAIRAQVARIAGEPSLAAQVRAFVLAHDGVRKAASVLDGYIDRAIACLSLLPEGPARERLVTLAQYIGTREQ